MLIQDYTCIEDMQCTRPLLYIVAFTGGCQATDFKMKRVAIKEVLSTKTTVHPVGASVITALFEGFYNGVL